MSDRWLGVWDLSQPITTTPSGKIQIRSEIVDHIVVAGGRWLIVLGGDGRLYAIDLESSSFPSAVEFFRLKNSTTGFVGGADSNTRFAVAEKRRQLAYIWHASQFDESRKSDD